MRNDASSQDMPQMWRRTSKRFLAYSAWCVLRHMLEMQIGDFSLLEKVLSYE